MKKIFLLPLFWCATNAGFAQKKLITHDTWKSWESLGEYGVSDNGKYVYYEHHKSIGDNRSLVIADTDGSSKFEIKHRKPGFAAFTADSRSLMFLLKGDSLAIVNLDTKKNKLPARYHQRKTGGAC